MRYDPTLETLERNYDRSDLLLLFYESMMVDKAGTLDTVCDRPSIGRLKLPVDQLDKRDNATEVHMLPTTMIEEFCGERLPVRNAVDARFPEARSACAKIAVRDPERT